MELDTYNVTIESKGGFKIADIQCNKCEAFLGHLL